MYLGWSIQREPVLGERAWEHEEGWAGRACVHCASRMYTQNRSQDWGSRTPDVLVGGAGFVVSVEGCQGKYTMRSEEEETRSPRLTQKRH